MTELIRKLSKIAPTYSFDATQNATAPYITYTLSETPIRTKSGIAGYEGTLSLGVYAASRSACSALVERIVEALDRGVFDDRKLYFSDAAESEYQDIGIISKELTFNTLR